MKNLIKSIVKQAALNAGLPEGRVLDESSKDNLTIPRPRIELQWLGEAFTSSVKTLAATRAKDATGQCMELKTQLYTVKEEVAANILADDEDWLADFYPRFLSFLPRGITDAQGNWVKIRAARASSSGYAKKHLGTRSIQVFSKASQLLVLTFEWRVTKTERFKLINKIDIRLPKIK